MEWASDLGEKGTREGLGFLGSECLTGAQALLQELTRMHLGLAGWLRCLQWGGSPGLACGSVY